LVDHSIQRAMTCIRDHRDHVARLEQNGGDATNARRSLANCEHLHDLFIAHRRLVVDRLAHLH
jgi:cobalamin biosynthesis Co2+ chelatase CbiK